MGTRWARMGVPIQVPHCRYVPPRPATSWMHNKYKDNSLAICHRECYAYIHFFVGQWESHIPRSALLTSLIFGVYQLNTLAVQLTIRTSLSSTSSIPRPCCRISSSSASAFSRCQVVLQARVYRLPDPLNSAAVHKDSNTLVTTTMISCVATVMYANPKP